MMPSRNSSTHNTKIAPWTISTQDPSGAREFCSDTKQRHQHDLAVGMPVHVGQRGHAEHQHLQPARQPRHGGRQRERDQLVARRGIPQRPGALFVVAHRADDFAERGIQHAQDEGVAQREHGQREVVHRHHAVQVEDAEELAARHALQPVLAAGESCLHRDEMPVRLMASQPIA
ncbi:hypothetical protein G6F66_013926 [Rhizopus arrhizus]|nr:hypothetical protein G6F66_013926 [Rhizopus arrhizus]